jgi:hypothetical protein
MEKAGINPPTDVAVAPALALTLKVTMVSVVSEKRKARTRCESPKSASRPSAQPKLPETA